MKLVLIEWLDSHSGRGWRDLDRLKEECEPLYCRSVGWLIANKNGHTTIVPHVAGGKNGTVIVTGTGDLTIPNKLIQRVVVLRKG